MNAGAKPRRSAPWLVALGIILAGGSAVQAQQTEDEKFTRSLREIHELLGSGHFQEARDLAERAYAQAQTNEAVNPLLAHVFAILVAQAETNLGNHGRAERLMVDAINAFLKAQGPDNRITPRAFADLGNLLAKTNRLADAEAMLRRAVQDSERVLGPQSEALATACAGLAECLSDRKEYAEAIDYNKRALQIFRASLGPTNQQTLKMQLNLSRNEENLGRNEEALALRTQVIDICQRSGGKLDFVLSWALQDLGTLEAKLKRYKDAQSHFEQSIAVSLRSLGPDHPQLVDSYRMLASVLISQGRNADAIPYLAKAIAILEKVYRTETFELAEAIFRIGAAMSYQGLHQEARRFSELALGILKKSNGPPELWSQVYLSLFLSQYMINPSKLSPTDWEYLRKSFDMMEIERASIRNSQDRSRALAKNNLPYEILVDIRSQQKLTPEAVSDVFSTMERYHARGLLDEMSLAGVDRDAGLPPQEQEARKIQEAELHRRISQLENQSARKAEGVEAKALRAQLFAEREALYDFYRHVTTSSPVYKAMLSRKTELPSLTEIRTRLLKPGDLLLEYLSGEKGTFVLAVTTEQTFLQSIAVTGQESLIMGVPQGKLTGPLLRQAFVNDQKTGLIQQLADPNVPVPTGKLKFMWNAVVPEIFHKPLTDGTIKRLIVIPSGPLAMFPFETLLTEGPEGPAYLLDSGPPIITAPSTAVLYSLANRPSPAVPASSREPVLAVGDPAYPLAAVAGGDRGDPATRFSMAGGRLLRLPYSGVEATWVTDAYRENVSSALLLTGEAATESAVRTAMPGRKIVHLACHGLADESLDNFFASLAFTPGPQGVVDPANDGFLTLAEIYGINLGACELAILSACQTNFGPQQKGEGTLSLSRGFLIAGARRVIASNWLVDDKAAATLISAFCSELATLEKAKKTPDYARTLQAAKRSIRRQAQWQAPYYWASLQLLGAP